MFLCFMFLMLSRLFIAALCSPAGKGLTCDVYCIFCYFPIWNPGSGVMLDSIVF